MRFFQTKMSKNLGIEGVQVSASKPVLQQTCERS